MKIRILYILISLTLALPVGAQKRKTARPVLSPEEQALLEKRQRMMATTQKVMFIDSLSQLRPSACRQAGLLQPLYAQR